MNIAIGHYYIGANDGVNTVIWRTITKLQELNPHYTFSLFGKASENINNYLPWKAGQLTYCDMPEIAPDYAVPGLEGKTIEQQQAHDYIWHGTNLAKMLQQKFANTDIVLMENLSVGVNPSLTYAFYLWTLWEYRAGSKKRFFVRVHDFAQQRPANFANIKKFQAFLPTEMPDWHPIMYPSTPNIEYITINTFDYHRLVDHGIVPERIWYVPNSVDDSLTRCQQADQCQALRSQLNHNKGIDPDAAILFYPVRAIPRKNVEEAMFLLKLMNNLAQMPEYKDKYDLDKKYHLVVSLDGASKQEKEYSRQLKDFAQANNLPVTIDISDMVGLHRQYDPDDPGRIVKYGVSDMYSIARMTVSTSILEGFGFVFIEPWLAGQCVIGRNIPYVTMDFSKAGVTLGHLYNALLVNGNDFADLGTDKPDGGLEMRLNEINKLDSPEYLSRIMNKNSASMRSTLRLFRKERRRNPSRNMVYTNRNQIMKHYSSSVVGALINRIFQGAEPTYADPRPAGRSPAVSTFQENLPAMY